MPFPADSRIKPPIVCLHLKLSPWQAAAGSCQGRGSPWKGTLKSRTPPMTSPVPQHLPAVTAPTHPDFHLQMFIMLLPTCFSSRPPAPELIHLKIIKLYEFCCRAKPCHPTRSQLNGSIDGAGGCSEQKGWHSCSHIPPELLPASETTRLTSQSFWAAFLLPCPFDTSLISVQNLV